MIVLAEVSIPLPDVPGYRFRNRWVGYRSFSAGRYTDYSVTLAGQEVARLEIDWDSDLYEGMEPIAQRLLEIEFLDVRDEWRLQGIGTLIVREVARLHPDYRLMARSEGADRFWAGLGWVRHEHEDGPDRYRPLYLAPEGWC